MSKPVVSGLVATQGPDGTGGSFSCNLPPSVAGDLLIVVARAESAWVVTSNGGFTLAYQGNNRTAVFYKVAQGNEGLSTGFTSSVYRGFNCAAYCIKNWGGDPTKHLAFNGTYSGNTGGYGDSDRPDPPPLTLPVSFAPYADVMFIAALGSTSVAYGLVSYPEGYTSGQIVSGEMGYVALCNRVVSASYEDPPAARQGQPSAWITITLAVCGKAENVGNNLFFGSSL